MKDKYHFFIENPDFIWHVDNDSEEVDDINKYCKTTIGIYLDALFKEECSSLLK